LGVHANVTKSSIIVFDSFSDERDVQTRNRMRNNISKINNPARRFATDFSFRVSGEVMAILGPGSVAEYRTVDARRGKQQPIPPRALFSSVIAACPPATTPPEPLAVNASGHDTTTSSHNTSAFTPTDGELIASLASASMTADASAPSTPASRASYLAELSLVANHLCENAADESNRTNMLRKRCHETMLQQRGAQQHAAAVTLQRQQHQQRATANSMVNPKSETTTPSDAVTPYPRSAADASVSTSSFFFAPVLRPADVHQTLIQTAAHAACRKRRRGSDDDDASNDSSVPAAASPAHHWLGMEEDGNALNSSSGCGTGEQGRSFAARNHCRLNTILQTASSTESSFSASSSYSDFYPADSVCMQLGSAIDTVSACPSPVEPPHPRQEGHATLREPPSQADASYAAAVKQTSFFSTSATSCLGGSHHHPPPHHLPPITTRSFPPPLFTSVDDLAPADRQQPRVSSSDLVFASFACPVPVAGLLNLSDIHFRRSSEELIALSVLQEMGNK
jgi:hypothetical protein